MQAMHSNHLLVSGHQAQVPQGSDTGYQYDSCRFPLSPGKWSGLFSLLCVDAKAPFPPTSSGFFANLGHFFSADGHGHAAAPMADDPLSRQTYYWGQSMAPDVPTTTAMSYTMGSQQQMYNWRDVPAIDPTGGQVASYWDPNQQNAAAPPPPAPNQGGRHGESKHSSRKDGGRSRRWWYEWRNWFFASRLLLN